mmetsp:Transcript_8758/g.27916  ORF Transcript_8758/g.27916 Transcript_8758/m.27916 type:complete len:201 (-) Transcript_8758:329-931(-)
MFAEEGCATPVSLMQSRIASTTAGLHSSIWQNTCLPRGASCMMKSPPCQRPQQASPRATGCRPSSGLPLAPETRDSVPRGASCMMKSPPCQRPQQASPRATGCRPSSGLPLAPETRDSVPRGASCMMKSPPCQKPQQASSKATGCRPSSGLAKVSAPSPPTKVPRPRIRHMRPSRRRMPLIAIIAERPLTKSTCWRHSSS